VGGEGWGNSGALRRRNGVNPRDARGWRRGGEGRTLAPRIDTGADEETLSHRGGPSLVTYPGLFEGDALVTEPPRGTCEGARQRLGSGLTEASVKARNKIGGQTIPPLPTPGPLSFARIPATYGTFAYTRVRIYRVFGDRSNDRRLRTETGNRFLTGDVDRHEWEINKNRRGDHENDSGEVSQQLSILSISELTSNSSLRLSRHLKSSFMRKCAILKLVDSCDRQNCEARNWV